MGLKFLPVNRQKLKDQLSENGYDMQTASLKIGAAYAKYLSNRLNEHDGMLSEYDLHRLDVDCGVDISKVTASLD